jgi:hypothetical protein
MNKASFTKVSTDEMLIEATVQSSYVDEAINKFLGNSGIDYENEIQAFKSMGKRFDDPEVMAIWSSIAVDLARRTFIKETERNNIAWKDSINFHVKYDEPPRKGKPFHFTATFPIYHPKKERRPSQHPVEEKFPGFSIVVVNVPTSLTEQNIIGLFQTVGKVLAVKLMVHSGTKEKLESIVVSYAYEKDAISAYFKFSGSYAGHSKPMKIRFMDENLQVPATHGDLPGSFEEPKHYF